MPAPPIPSPDCEAIAGEGRTQFELFLKYTALSVSSPARAGLLSVGKPKICTEREESLPAGRQVTPTASGCMEGAKSGKLTFIYAFPGTQRRFSFHHEAAGAVCALDRGAHLQRSAAAQPARASGRESAFGVCAGP